jgi:hypothetical protein
MKHFSTTSAGGRVVSAHLSLSHGPAEPHRALAQSRVERRRALREMGLPDTARKARRAVQPPRREPSPGYCTNNRGRSIYHLEQRVVVAQPCGRWNCSHCGPRKARKVAERFARLEPHFLMTLSLARSAWATRENCEELQRKWRSLCRYMKRHGLLAAYGWVPEEGAPRPECVCDDSRNGCACGANGWQLHRHFLLRMRARKGFRPGWMPYAQLQAIAKRLGLGTLDFRPIDDAFGAARYVSKYLFKAAGEAVGGSRRRFTLTERNADPPSVGWVSVAMRPALVAVEFLGAVAVDWDATRWSALDSS